MKHSIIISCLLALLVLGCAVKPNGQGTKTAREELDALDSPDVVSVEASLERGALDALKNADYSKSAALYQQLVDQDNKEFRYKLGLAESLRRMGELKVAIEMYDQIIELKPGHVDAFEGKALAVMAQGDVEEASKLFQRILEREPNRWRSLNALGILFASKNLPSDGMQYLDEALIQSPKNPSVLNNIGLVQAMMKQYPSAVDSLDKGSRYATGGQRKQIDLNLALVHGIFGQMDKARDIVENYYDGAALENNLGLYAHLANNDELAKSYLNMALSGSNQYYERAWKNLDMVANKSASEYEATPGQKNFVIPSEGGAFSPQGNSTNGAPMPLAAPTVAPPNAATKSVDVPLGQLGPAR